MVATAPLPPSTDPIRSTQHTFRQTLDALSWPGALQQLTINPTLAKTTFNEHPQLIWPATLLLMLVDHEVSLAVTGIDGADVLASIAQRRTRVAKAPVETACTVVCDGSTLTPDLLTALKRGSLEYPDDGATLIVLVDDLTKGDAPRVTLTGPGIDGERSVSLPAFTPETLAAREHVVAQYPMGIDILILDGMGRLLGLPRTTATTTASTISKEA